MTACKAALPNQSSVFLSAKWESLPPPLPLSRESGAPWKSKITQGDKRRGVAAAPRTPTPTSPLDPETERQGGRTWLHGLETNRFSEVADDSQGVPVGKPADRRPVHLQQHIPRAGRLARDDAAGAPAGLLPEPPQVRELAALRAAPDLSAQVARGPGPGHGALLHLAEPVLLLLQRLRHPEPRCTMGETPHGRRGRRSGPLSAWGPGGPCSPARGPRRSGAPPTAARWGRAAPSPATPLGRPSRLRSSGLPGSARTTPG